MYLTQYWDSESPPDDVASLLRTFPVVNSDLEYRRFNQRTAQAFIAERFSDREVSAFRACAVPAMQADFFRYCAVLAEGGFYVDADNICTAPLSTLLGDEDDGVLFRREDRKVIINGAFAIRDPGHPLMQVSLEIATAGIERRISDCVWITTGPGIFTYLHLLSTGTGHDVDMARKDPYSAATVSLCLEVVEERDLDLHALFDGLKLRSFEELQSTCRQADPGYKAGGKHWTNWDGSIFV